MNASDYIKSIVSPEMILQFYNISIDKPSDNVIRCSCPIHGGNNNTAFVFNLNTKLWYCHTRCKTGGDIFDFVMALEHIDFISSIKKIARDFNIDIEHMEIQQRTDEIQKEHKRWLMYMSQITKAQHINKEYDINILGELNSINKFRNFDKDILTRFDIKYSQHNKRIIVPIYQNEICIGVSMRSTANQQPKWLHQPTGLKTSSCLYNIDNIKRNEPIIITEGIWDALTYIMYGYTNCISTFGCHLGKEQENKLLQLAYSFIIAYDNDVAGIKGTEDIINKLKHKANLQIANIPTGKDAGECTKEEIVNSIKTAKQIYEWRR